MKFVLRRSKDKTNMEVLKIQYPISKTTYVNIDKGQDGLEVTKNVTQLFKKEVVVNGKISNNLYSSAVKSGMEPNIIIEFARIFGFEVDFQRDIRKGDVFEVLYERYADDNNKIIKTGKILYAYLNVNNQKIKLYRFGKKNDYDFYDEKGKSIRKALMKTPINGARLSSPFGMRKHPILGFSKHHNGTDFAAPTGTPIMASGNGTVIKAGWCGNGGKCVRIRHNSSYTTGYGHMSKIATRSGRRVSQGQIIGYVGNTGMSTGPHLHYTVSYNGKFINSQRLKLPSGKILKGENRKLFEIERIKLDVKVAEIKS
ncbi:MAG: peptidase M23 [Candidatus Pelagibacter sp.]|nr:peptidase M23 [Candidatus Pelagibacter sp.]